MLFASRIKQVHEIDSSSRRHCKDKEGGVAGGQNAAPLPLVSSNLEVLH